MSPFSYALVLSLAAGAMIPLGGALAAVERVRPRWLEEELRHSVIAFGGGALLAAVALVLVPEGIENLSLGAAVTAFAGGGLVFLAVDRAVARSGGSAAQLLAMLLDFVPEAVALGAALAGGSASGGLLAFLIGLQNLPEGFNAYRELDANTGSSRRGLLAGFAALALLGPLAAWIGVAFLSHRPALLGALMVFSAGGILYLIFQDIAPQARLERAWAPSLGAVAGFLLGLVGHMLIPG